MQRTGDPRAPQRLRRPEFVAQRHQAGHLGLGDGDLGAAEIGQGSVGDNVIGLFGEGVNQSVEKGGHGGCSCAKRAAPASRTGRTRG